MVIVLVLIQDDPPLDDPEPDEDLRAARSASKRFERSAARRSLRVAGGVFLLALRGGLRFSWSRVRGW
jgi:hypothetical protein